MGDEDSEEESKSLNLIFNTMGNIFYRFDYDDYLIYNTNNRNEQISPENSEELNIDNMLKKN